MGNRISIGFRQKSDWEERDGWWKSVVLFSHWDGRALLNEARAYARMLKAERKASQCEPLDRLEPPIVLINFMRWYLRNEGEFVTHNYYLGKDPEDGDNSDNGHFWITL